MTYFFRPVFTGRIYRTQSASVCWRIPEASKKTACRTGKKPVEHKVFAEALDLLRQRQRDIAEARAKLERWMDAAAR